MDVSRDSHSQLYVPHLSFTKPFGFKVVSAMETLNVRSVSVYPCRFPRVGYWQKPDISVCGPDILNENFLPDFLTPVHYSWNTIPHIPTTSPHLFLLFPPHILQF